MSKGKEEFQAASEDAAGPLGSKRAFLGARKTKVDVESKLGMTEKLDARSSLPEAVREQGGGYFCEVCQCLLKDSVSYLDHINGKKHQRALGFSMRVERVGLAAVKERFKTNKRKHQASTEPKVSSMQTYEAKIAALRKEEEDRKRRKKEAKQKKQEEEAAQAQAGMDPEMMAMMGFGGFGGGKKS